MEQQEVNQPASQPGKEIMRLILFSNWEKMLFFPTSHMPTTTAATARIKTKENDIKNQRLFNGRVQGVPMQPVLSVCLSIKRSLVCSFVVIPFKFRSRCSLFDPAFLVRSQLTSWVKTNNGSSRIIEWKYSQTRKKPKHEFLNLEAEWMLLLLLLLLLLPSTYMYVRIFKPTKRGQSCLILLPSSSSSLPLLFKR